jgi:hypothetical protein
MKKIIALAVAGAFVAPAMAADVTLSGTVEYQFEANDQTNVNDFKAVDSVIAVGASSELANGMTISASIAIEAAADAAVTNTSAGTVAAAANDGGDNITISGDFGKISIGDVSGGMDAVGDWSDVSPAYGEFGADGDDAAFAFVPSLGIDGLSVTISATPEGDARNSEGTSYGVSYTVGAFSAYYGKDETAAAAGQQSSAGVKYSADGIMVAYESGESPTTSSSGKVEYKGIAATYTMGDLKLGYEIQEQKDDGTVDKDETVLSAVYTLGDGVIVYIAKADDDKASTVVDKTAIGIEYAF